MRKSLFTAAIIVALTACIGITLWANGYPPEKVGLTEAKSQIRSIVTFPLFWAGFGLLLTGLAIWIKRERLAEVSGKSALIPAMSVQFPALIGLLMQVLIPLDLYDYIGSDGSQIALFYFIALAIGLIGNFVVTVPFQSKVGFRTAATLSDHTVWTKTHRMLGRRLVAIVLVTLPLPFLVGGQIAQWILIGLVCALKAVTWLQARQLAARQSLRRSITN